MMNRRDFIKGVGAGIGAMTVAQNLPASARAAGKRNVLLYVADDLGMDLAGCYGNTIVRTPGVDSLAKEGVRFTQAFCTTPSCSPSRSVLLTGLYNHANGQYGLAHGYNHFVSLPGFKSLPIRLADAGYRTICAGKFHVEPEAAYHFQETLQPRTPVKLAEQCRAIIADPSEKPFFLYFCPTEPHRPFKRETSKPVDPKDVTPPPYLPDTAACREDLAEYYGSIEQCDSGLLRLIEILKETGRWDDTLILFVSDNGAPFPGAKTTLYEPGVRLPCVARDPGAKETGRTSDAMITWADITPTILEYAGVPGKEGDFHGRSFLPALSGDLAGRDEVFLSHTFHEITMYYPMRCVRTRRHKLIWNIASGLEFPYARDLYESKTWQDFLAHGGEFYGKRKIAAYQRRPRFELYDLEADPWETENLAERPEHQELLDALKKKLRAFSKDTRDPWVLKWDRE